MEHLLPVKDELMQYAREAWAHRLDQEDTPAVAPGADEAPVLLEEIFSFAEGLSDRPAEDELDNCPWTNPFLG
jgi:hypothetical protein